LILSRSPEHPPEIGLFPDHAVPSEQVGAIDLFLHPDIHFVLYDGLERFGPRMVELGDMPAFGIKDVIAVELLPLLFDVIIGTDINAVFVVDIEKSHWWKVFGDLKSVSGPNPLVAPGLLDKPLLLGLGDFHMVAVLYDPPEGLPFPVHKSELIFEEIETDKLFLAGEFL
jgi:hypothetical protein